MKRKGRTKKHNQLTDSPHSTQSNSLNWKINKLVTSQEQTLASQASIYTQKTNKTRTTDLHKEQDFLQDEVNRDQINDIFISEEEERVIKTVLEIARKGKITQKNSFEIPLKVVENDEQFMLKTRFWKFASELLGASVSIYDKRVENTWLTANKIDSKLKRIRINKKDFKDDEEEEETTKRKSNQDFIVLQDFFCPESVNYQTIGSNTLQEQKKRNVANFNKQFIVDPLFFKKLKTFDQVNLSSMLMNTFEITNTLQIKLFQEESYENRRKPDEDMKTNTEYLSYIEKIVEKPSQMLVVKGVNELRTAFFHPEKKQKERLMNDQILQDLKELEVDFEKFSSIQNEEKFDPLQTQQMNMPQSEFYEQSINQPDTYTVKSQPLRQEGLFFHEPISENFNEGNYTSMMPWEIHLKGQKLKRKRTMSKQGKKTSKKKVDSLAENEIDFDEQTVEDRRMILKKGKTKYSNKKGEKNLLPLSFGVYQKHNWKKLQSFRNFETQQKQPFFLQKGEEEMNTIKEEQEEGEINFEEQIQENVSFFGNFQPETEEQNARYRKYYEKNIRKVKDIVFQQLNEERELKLSQLNTMLSPQNMLITFLHLANERQLVIESNEDFSDVSLAFE